MVTQTRDQLGLFEKVNERRILEDAEPEPLSDVLLGGKTVQYPLRAIRREAIKKLLEALKPLEGKDVFVEFCGGSRSHFWVDNLRLSKMRVDIPSYPLSPKTIPMTIWLRGNRNASVMISTECLRDVRIQEYFGYTLYLIDFWNGFGEYPIEPYKPDGSTSIGIRLFKD